MATPAAILNILVNANTGKAVAELRAVDKAADTSGKSMGKLGKAAKVGGLAAAAGIGLAVVASKGFVDAARDAEASGAKVRTMLKNQGISWKEHGKAIDAAIQKHSQLTGIDDEELSESFANMVRTTHDVNKALKLNALAADVARTKGQNLAGAQSLIARVYNGNYMGLKKLGIAYKPTTDAVDRLKASTKSATKEQMAAAEAQDKVANQQKAIALLQKNFGGQAEAYGKTSAGAQERFGVAIENLQEALGKGLLPVLTTVSNALANFTNDLTNGTGTVGRYRDAIALAFSTVAGVVGSAVTSIDQYLKQNQEAINSVALIADHAFRYVLAPAFQFVLGVAQRVLPAISQMMRGTATVIAGIVNVIAGILTLNFAKAWRGVKQIFSGGLNVMLGQLRAVTAPIREAGSRIGNALLSGIKGGVSKVGSLFSGLGHTIANSVRGSLGSILSFFTNLGTSIARSIGSGISSLKGKGIPFVPGIATGGLIAGNPARGDVVPALLKGGEVVLNETQQRLVGKGAIFSALRATGAPVVGGGGGTVKMAGGGSVAATAVGVARRMKASPKETLALIEAGIVESGLRNLSYGDRDSVGFLQQRPSQGWTGLRNVPKAAAEFLRKAMAINSRSMTAGQLAQAVQRSAFPGRYDAVRDRAQAIIDGLGGKTKTAAKTKSKAGKGGKGSSSFSAKSAGRLSGVGAKVSSSGSSAGAGDAADTSAADELNAHLSAIADLTGQMVANQNKILALSNQGPEILASVVAAVSGGIGGKTGLGFQSVGIPGSVARY